MYSKLTEWNNFGLLTERIGLVLVYKVLEDGAKTSYYYYYYYYYYFFNSFYLHNINRKATHP